MEELKSPPNLLGDKEYQKKARLALPILVRQASVSQKIYYSDLASELDMPNPRNLNYVLGEIGNSLLELSKIWNEKVPPIQCIVISKSTELPGEGINWFIEKSEDFKNGSPSEKKQLLNEMLFDVFHYEKWSKVLEHFNLEANNLPIKTFTKYNGSALRIKPNGGGESEFHKNLKETISKNPDLLNLKDYGIGKTEYLFPSADTIDVLFENNKSIVGIEVKSKISNEADIIRGMFQCIKYESLIEAQNRVNGFRKKIRVILVLENEFPINLIPMKNVLSIDVMDLLSEKIKNDEKLRGLEK
ncbi:hypothetical protein DLM77_15375 [Leptospira yasudae]|uniref:Protein NO VEIN C-terminal domain-containing protein n=1 Tax=Leptospira yasudae TaxID=2202201 RepID=A0ABX9M0H7_9LEPT|nr:hypothetical protein DLM77_15375 [Leptospira yasudae]